MTDPDFDAELQAMWARSKPVVLDRCALVAAATAADADAAARADAREAAHKLAGSLGMFGLPESSGLAREVDERIVAGVLEHDEGRRDVAVLIDRLRAAITDDR